MPKLYVANATQQIRQFTYWVAESPRHFVQEIPIGGQVLLAGRELTVLDIEAIIKQHIPYGLLEVGEALKSRSNSFDGIAYQLDRAVSYDKLLQLVERYNSVLNTRGKQLRQEAAIAASEFIDQQLFQAQAPARLESLELSIEEVNRDQRDETPEISEGTRVVKGHIDEPSRPPVRRRRSS